ncbi:MAG: hypothetical protein EOO06_18425 [Chitinophagaceae bacterium]|nr:MAG: hypothetical protein EOO06_18425 [Chitinophagaceae bacterium]
MSDGAKILFSELEAGLAADPTWILTKHSIIRKVSALLAAQFTAINTAFEDNLFSRFPELRNRQPKITRGEQYQQLPYVILDYPAIFSKEAVIALRTMFWWGNFISITLHLSGHYKRELEASIAANLAVSGADLYVSNGTTEWEHDLIPSNYTRADQLSTEALYKKIVQPSFVKIALQFDLGQLNHMEPLLGSAYEKLSALTKA